MSQIGGRSTVHTDGASSNVYTVLTFIALVAVLFGIIFVWYYSQQWFGTSHPFEVDTAGRLSWAGELARSRPV